MQYSTRSVFSRTATVLIPALLIVGICAYVLNTQKEPPKRLGNLPGRPLASYTDIYPVRHDDSGHLYLDIQRFIKAINFLKTNPSPKAISDLAYLGQMNNVSLMMNEAEQRSYQHLLENPAYQMNARHYDQERDRVFQVYKDIVNGIGQTFAGTGMEIVLHDTRNPLKSVVAIQNPISGRRLGDPTTNFGLELIRNYSLIDSRGASYVSYPLKLKDGRAVKSTTVPLYDEVYGLIGFICLNLDISKLDAKASPEAAATFIENIKLTTNNDKITELIENSRRKPQ